MISNMITIGGRNDYCAGKKLSDCPYPKDSFNAIHWANGWQLGKIIYAAGLAASQHKDKIVLNPFSEASGLYNCWQDGYNNVLDLKD